MKIEKVRKLAANLHDKTEYVILIRNLKPALNHKLVLKNVHQVIKFNEKVWLKSYINMNTKLKQKTKNDFEEDFFKLNNNLVFGKVMENARKHKDIKLLTAQSRRNYLFSGPKYHATKFFLENLLAIEMRKTQILMNKLVYLSLSILDVSNTVMREFCYDYVKRKYGEKAKRFVVHVKTDDIIKTL